MRGGATGDKKGGGIQSALVDPSLITGALVAVGQFYSSSLESSPILTKSVTVRTVTFQKRKRHHALAFSCAHEAPLLLYLVPILLFGIMDGSTTLL
jgi:hypothetical protein